MIKYFLKGLHFDINYYFGEFPAILNISVLEKIDNNFYDIIRIKIYKIVISLYWEV